MAAVPERLEIVRLGHPQLRSVAEPVPASWLSSGRLVDLAQTMIRTMLHGNGVGLAAPQVAEGLRLFVYWLPASESEVELTPTAVVNPELKMIGDEKVEDWEGCLSIPGLRGLVPRFRRLKLKGLTPEGDLISLTADGFHARVIQHEYDHLDGVVFLDRMMSVRSLAFEPEWEKYVLAASAESGPPPPVTAPTP